MRKKRKDRTEKRFSNRITIIYRLTNIQFVFNHKGNVRGYTGKNYQFSYIFVDHT